MRALLVMVAIATAACQASSAGWAYPQDRTSSLTDAASLYEGAADVFGQEIDVAFQPHLAAGPTPLRSAIRAYYEAGAAATWRFATTIAIIRGDPDLNAAVARVAALGSTEAALQRLALAAPDPGASLADLYRAEPAIREHRSTVDTLRKMLGLPPSRNDVGNFF